VPAVWVGAAVLANNLIPWCDAKGAFAEEDSYLLITKENHSEDLIPGLRHF